MSRIPYCWAALALLLLAAAPSMADPVETEFTYQGRLTDSGLPAHGSFDMVFRLFPTESSDGSDVLDTYPDAGSITVSATRGLFTVTIEFDGLHFHGERRWLEIEVEGTTLSPRQELTPAPYALALPGLWTENNTTSPNIIGGHKDNWVLPAVVGATIGGGGSGGLSNSVSDDYAVIGGGEGNRVESPWTTIGGGENNFIFNDGAWSTIAGGANNDMNAALGTIGGGSGHTVEGLGGTIGGGGGNTVGDPGMTDYDDYATIGGGAANTASYKYSTIGGGRWNNAGGSYVTIAGGNENEAPNIGAYAAIGGGYTNSVRGSYGVISGGNDNEVTAECGTIGGGQECKAWGQWSTAAGGYRSTATGNYSTVGGGNINTAGNDAATVAGGASNQATNTYSTVGGGEGNQATGQYATVAGGYQNIASTYRATVAGGWGNTASGYNGFVGGGRSNNNSGDTAVIGGGFENLVTARWSTIPGGNNNRVEAESSMACGAYATVYPGHDNTFVWSDGTGFGSTGSHQFLISASDGVGIQTNAPMGFQLAVNGTAAKPGGGSWSVYSDRRLKTDIRPLENALERLLALRGVTYEYTKDAGWLAIPGRQVGLIAQEVEEVFPDWVAEDANGYKYTTIRGLEALVVEALRELRCERETEIEALRAENQELLARVARLEALIQKSAAANESDD
ncbi:MAG: tail fiber domain-containing protein [Phycisphaerae bacterium]|nr:tail fiber domain-containing protein [Phycisphaerae bacterium]